MSRSLALFARPLQTCTPRSKSTSIEPSIRLNFSSLGWKEILGNFVFKSRISYSHNMSSKILYRRVLPSQELPSSTPTLTHPHKAPSIPPHHSNSPPPSPHPRTATDEVTSTSNDQKRDETNEQPAPSKDVVTTTTHSLDVQSAKNQAASLEGQEPTSSDDVGTAAKVTLGKVTEIRGVIFDMDGTLTLPVLRFAEMKEKLGLKPTDDILPTVQKLPPEEQAKAFEIIEEFEREGIENMKLQPGVLDLFHFLAERDLKRALMTRNAWVPTNAFLKRLREELEANKEKYPSLTSEELFSKIITREFEPCKPHPASVFEICKHWDLKPDEVVIVGDDKTDMMCGLRAGVGVNFLLRNERNMKQPDYSHFNVNRLSEIITLMSSLMAVPFKREP